MYVRRAAQRTFRLSAMRSSLISAVEATGRALIAFVLRLAPAAPRRAAPRPVRSVTAARDPLVFRVRFGANHRDLSTVSSIGRYRMSSQWSESK